MNTRTMLTGTGITLALLIGGSAVVAQSAMPAPAAPGLVASAAGAPAGTADAALTARLLFAIEEERVARDLYQLFGTTYGGARPFSMIVRSEQQHVSAIQGLLTAYGITDTTGGRAAGSYVDPALQALYDQWKAQGLASLEAAEKVGVDLEKRDIADLEATLATHVPSDVATVLTRLRDASKNHLSAFTNAVTDTVAPGAGTARPNGTGWGAGRGTGTGSGNGNSNGHVTPCLTHP
ncbi:MAG: DUF2202 domain-containing protein [Candidatus Phosphoribacter sp.]